MNTCTGRDSASSGSEFDPTDPQREIKQIFQCFDADGDGFIDRSVMAINASEGGTKAE